MRRKKRADELEPEIEQGNSDIFERSKKIIRSLEKKKLDEKQAEEINKRTN